MPGYYGNPYISGGYFPQQQPQMQPQMPQQVQNNGFISVPNEDIVNTYPIAPGNCVTFKIEGKPIVIEKSMGFSQFESPKIDRYRLVREDQKPHVEPATSETNIPLADEIKRLWSEINDIKKELPKKKKEVKEYDDTSDAEP